MATQRNTQGNTQRNSSDSDPVRSSARWRDVTYTTFALPEPAAPSQRHRARRSIALDIVRAVTGIDSAGIGRRCPHCGSRDHGQPSVTGAGAEPWHISLSHTAHLSALALAPVPVGIDLADPTVSADWDQADRLTEGRLGLVADHHPGLGFHHTWALLEAVGKLDGSGLSIEPTHLVDRLASSPFTTLQLSAHRSPSSAVPAAAPAPALGLVPAVIVTG